MDVDPTMRGARAQQIINDPLFQEAFDGLERGAIERIAACDTNDTRTLQALTQSLQAVRAVRHRMEMWIAEGKDVAERAIKKELQPPLLSRFRRTS